MTTELQIVHQEAPTANKRLLAILRTLLKHARAGEIQSLAVSFMLDGGVQFEYEIEDGHELTIASAARQMEEVIRFEVFGGGEED